ncbi:hypothetical protein EV714DRAFT_275667 [Schizophyllum commune]
MTTTNCMHDEISFGSGVLLADVYAQISANTNPQYDGPVASAYDEYGPGFWMDPRFLAGIMSPWPSLEENSMNSPPFQDLPPEIRGLLDDCDVSSEENIRHHSSLLSLSLALSSPSATYSTTSSASVSSDAITPDEILSSEGLQDVIDAAPSPAYLHGPFNTDGQPTFVVSHEERLLPSSATASGPVEGSADIAVTDNVQHALTYRETAILRQLRSPGPTFSLVLPAFDTGLFRVTTRIFFFVSRIFEHVFKHLTIVSTSSLTFTPPTLRCERNLSLKTR